MENVMKYLICAACVAAVAASGVYLTGQYNAYAQQRAEDAAEISAIVAKAEAKAKLDMELRDMRDNARLAAIGQKGCDQAAIDVLWVSTTRPIKHPEDIPAQIHQDIRTCLNHDKVAAPDVAKIKTAGLYSLAIR